MVLLIHVAQMAGASFGLVEKLHKRQKKRNELNSVYDGGLLFRKTTVLVEQFDPIKRLKKGYFVLHLHQVPIKVKHATCSYL